MTSNWRERDFIDATEYAEVTGLSRASVYAQVKSGDIPSIKTGPRSIRIPTAHLKKLEDTLTSTD